MLADNNYLLILILFNSNEGYKTTNKLNDLNLNFLKQLIFIALLTQMNVNIQEVF